MSKTSPKDILNHLICEGFAEEIWVIVGLRILLIIKEVSYNTLSMRREHEETSLSIEGIPKAFHIKVLIKDV